MRISVRLLAARDGALLWSQKFDRKLKDAFAVQDEIARSVADELRVTLAGGPHVRLARIETEDSEAHALYLQGLYLWNRRTAQSLRQAITFFEQAVARDPKYARAYGGEALAYVLVPFYDDLPTDKMYGKSREAALHALALDSNLAEAHAALAWAALTQFRNHDAAMAFARAIAADSNFATARAWHGQSLNLIGRFDDGLGELARARELEPASLVINTATGFVLYGHRRYAAAESTLRRVTAIDSTFQFATVGLCAVLLERGQVEESIARLEKLVAVSGIRRWEKVPLLAYAYARAGRVPQAKETVAAFLRENSGQSPVSAALAAALDALGEHERAIVVLRTAVEQHDPWLTPFSRSAVFDRLRADPRAAALLAHVEAP